jgi:hypothetical protein
MSHSSGSAFGKEIWKDINKTKEARPRFAYPYAKPCKPKGN